MKRFFAAAALLAAAFTFSYMTSANAYNSFENSVNNTCGTTYDCSICHINPGGGGPLTSEGQTWVDFGNDDTVFCPTEPDPAPTPVPPPPPVPEGDNDSDNDSDSDSGGDSDSDSDGDSDGDSDD